MSRNGIGIILAGVVAAAVGLAAVLFATRSNDGAVAETLPDQRGISVSGQGEVKIRPDTATIDVGVSATADSVEQARRQAADAMAKVVAAAKANGIAEEDIQTSSFSIEPQYDYSSNTPVLQGYRVYNTVSVKIRGVAEDGSNVSVVIDETAKAAGNLAIVNGVTFSLEDSTGAIDQARTLAVQDAKRRADQFAAAAGVAVGDVVFIAESGSYPPPPMPYDGDLAQENAAADKSVIQPGQLAVTVNVNVTYAIP